MKTPNIKSLRSGLSTLSLTKPYYIPPNQQFSSLSPGESWLLKNWGKRSRPPRGQVYIRGKNRFENRTWQNNMNFLEFLPGNNFIRFRDKVIGDIHRKIGIPYKLL